VYRDSKSSPKTAKQCELATSIKNGKHKCNKLQFIQALMMTCSESNTENVNNPKS